MANEINFTYEEQQELIKQQIQDGKEASLWMNLDEGLLNNEITGLTSRINNVTTLLKNMVEASDYDNTNGFFSALWMNDLGVSGFIPSFFRSNDELEQHKNGATRPTWYHDLTPEHQRTFDLAVHYYRDCEWLLPVLEELRKLMMLYPLKTGFQLQRLTKNCLEAGFDENQYAKIDSDMKEVAAFLKKSWDSLERNASRSASYYEQNYRTKGKDELMHGYRLARIADYQAQFKATRAYDSFLEYADGSYGIRSAVIAKMKVLDKYTEKIAQIEHLEDDTKTAIESARKITSELLPAAYKNCYLKNMQALTNSLSSLIDTLYHFADDTLNMFLQYKDRDTEAPYCYMRKLSAFGEMDGRYGLTPQTSDPWHDGTQFFNLYNMAALALSDHSEDFIYHHGRQ
ncbi:MAG: hypothetical protein IJH44_02420 [Solobacterium sp.]|nr:hypothetical protein [Solobacterium sp.]MBQ6355786.1 hypothetical protein [Solobacterium sp.]MBR0213143.1 hypothetical protein [Solobacterium sp.]